jgi:rubrerythrin
VYQLQNAVVSNNEEVVTIHENVTCSRNLGNCEEEFERSWENFDYIDWSKFDQEIEDIILAMDTPVFTEIISNETEEERRHRQQFIQENRQTKVKRTHQWAQREITDEKRIKSHFCGKMDVICQYCGAIHFKKEQSSDKKLNLCCSKGKVIIPPSKECPELLHMLYTNCHPKSKDFIKDARKYNNALAFASLGAKIDTPAGRGPYCFKIHGQLYHNTTAVEYFNEERSNQPDPKYAQLYFLDSAQAN